MAWTDRGGTTTTVYGRINDYEKINLLTLWKMGISNKDIDLLLLYWCFIITQLIIIIRYLFFFKPPFLFFFKFRIFQSISFQFVERPLAPSSGWGTNFQSHGIGQYRVNYIWKEKNIFQKIILLISIMYNTSPTQCHNHLRTTVHIQEKALLSAKCQNLFSSYCFRSCCFMFMFLLPCEGLQPLRR